MGKAKLRKLKFCTNIYSKDIIKLSTTKKNEKLRFFKKVREKKF